MIEAIDIQSTHHGLIVPEVKWYKQIDFLNASQIWSQVNILQGHDQNISLSSFWTFSGIEDKWCTRKVSAVTY